jgi:sec-independent protein translocase protein TatC
MSVKGVVGIFRGPQGPVAEGGQMALIDHFRELRARLLRVALAMLIVFIVAFVYYSHLFELLLHPYNEARSILAKDHKESAPIITGVSGALSLQFKLCGLAAVILTSPYWLFQLWAFIMPGLHANERKWTRIFAAIAGPMFLIGVATGYWVLPKGLEALISFTPKNVQNFVDISAYLTFVVKMLLAFGVAFEIPLFVVMLNLAGVVSGRALARQRPWIVVGAFTFAAFASPAPDPLSMLLLALPLTGLFLVSEIIARLVDRRRATSKPQWSDDEASPL